MTLQYIFFVYFAFYLHYYHYRTSFCFFIMFWFYIIKTKFKHYSFYLSFSHSYPQQICCEKLRSMIISFWPLIISSPFCCYKFNISMFSDNFHNFSKNWIIHQPFLKSFFAFFVSLVFISACGLSFLIKLNLSMNSCQN